MVMIYILLVPFFDLAKKVDKIFVGYNFITYFLHIFRSKFFARFPNLFIIHNYFSSKNFKNDNL